jgi:hypothetical protein
MVNVEQANGRYPDGLQSVIASFVLQPPAAMGLPPLLLLLVESSALATSVNIFDVNYDPMLGTNFARTPSPSGTPPTGSASATVPSSASAPTPATR